MSYPTREERAKCWDARDKYWECLNKNEGKDESLCKDFRRVFESSCSAQWVKHFDRKRTYLIYKERIEKHGIPSQSKSSFCQPRRVYHKIVKAY
ncbi:cytochrome c oxidase assembly factor 6 homolog [Cylas formicarius]|uniref:cytochrome c oxidase assembly factor 6 homolog n=1 Tax=Cylas formicarius TaxID=197179 RepID=UPI0029583B10|nr:cytochrome c oxidase assembly factor 6 homolog [Cylas formicarius]